MESPSSLTASREIADAPPSAPTPEEIAIVESHVEANVQRSLDSFDAWKVMGPFRGDKPGAPPDPSKCTREHHTCDLESSEPDALCVGCAIYRRIVRERSAFPVGGRADVCDYLANAVAEPLIFAFIKNGQWLAPAAKFTGAWFVKHPITFAHRPRMSLVPASQVSVRRNKVRIYRAEDVLDRLGLAGARDAILRRLHDYWRTDAGGIFYSLDELLDGLGPLATIAQNSARLGLRASDIGDPMRVIAGIQDITADAAR